MSIAWPAGLAAALSREGWDEAFPDQLLSSPVDRGPAKVRRVTTAAVRLWSLSLQPLTAAEVNTLDTFFTTTTAGGALPFDMTHPRLGSRTVRFKPNSPPKPDPLGGLYWRVSLSLEILP